MKRPYLLLAVGLALIELVPGCKPPPDAATSAGQSGPQAQVRPAPSGPVELRISWPVGRRCVQRMELTQKSVMQLPQRKEPINQEVTLAQEYAISVLKDREPEGRELELEYLSAEMEIAVDNQPRLSFDSGGESLDTGNNPLSPVFRKMVGTRVKLLLDGKNEVESVLGMQELIQNLAKDVPPQSRSITTNMFGEQNFKQMVELGRGLPNHPVQPGDTWSSTNEIPMGPLGKARLELQHRFKEWDTREDRLCALLEFQGTMQSAGDPGEAPMGMKMQVANGTISGLSWFDPELGMALESDIHQELSLDITVPLPRSGDGAGGTQKITSNLNQDVKLRVVEWNNP